MFASALKSFNSNITNNYTISTTPTSTSGAWKVYDAKNKKTGKAVSVFVFERKTLEPHSGGLGSRSGGPSVKKLHDEVIVRIKKESSMLARLRHPSILEIAEPMEDTRSGGLMFATEPVTASLSGLLQEKDDQERAGGAGGRPSRFVVEESDGQSRKKELEIDELEIQKGLLQVAQGLEFLHESASLVHGNLTPDAIYVNVKSDWKIAGFGFAGPPDNSNSPSTAAPLSLSEVLYHDPRLPSSVQLNLDFTSPDFAMDGNVSTSADMFSLGLLLLALYNSPHVSPLKCNSNLPTYKKLFGSSSTTPSSGNNFLSSRPLPNEVRSVVLPRLITRRPAQRMNAREFQQSAFFDNILVSSIKFLDELPAKTPNEKSQFMRGLPKILDQFPKSVLEKKVLPALLEETKDRELLYLILQNVFKIMNILPSSRQAMTEKILPQMREVFLSTGKNAPGHDRDTSREAGLVVVLENISLIGDNCNGKEFKDDILPILHLGLESPTHAIVDKSLGCLPTILAVLDFSTIKNELFPVVAAVFSKTSSLGIKVRGLEAFVTLCGGSNDGESDDNDDFSGISTAPKPFKNSSAVLDKYTVQEKVVPLLKAMKTKEPAVMMAALAVFKQVGKIADTEFLAMETLPVLWSFSLGPLLNLQQFQQFMDLIRKLSARIESEQVKKLRDYAANATNSVEMSRSNDLMNMGATNTSSSARSDDVGDDDFQRLVLGSKSANSTDILGDAPARAQPNAPIGAAPPMFEWSSPRPSMNMAGMSQPSRTITPDQSINSMNAFAALSPTPSTGAQGGMQRTMANGLNSFAPMQPAKSNAWNSIASQQTAQQAQSTFSIPPPVNQPNNSSSSFSIAPPPAMSFQRPSIHQASPATSFQRPSINQPSPATSFQHPSMHQPSRGQSMNTVPGYNQNIAMANTQQPKKTGLDAYESLI